MNIKSQYKTQYIIGVYKNYSINNLFRSSVLKSSLFIVQIRELV